MPAARAFGTLQELMHCVPALVNNVATCTPQCWNQVQPFVHFHNKTLYFVSFLHTGNTVLPNSRNVFFLSRHCSLNFEFLKLNKPDVPCSGDKYTKCRSSANGTRFWNTQKVRGSFHAFAFVKRTCSSPAPAILYWRHIQSLITFPENVYVSRVLCAKYSFARLFLSHHCRRNC